MALYPGTAALKPRVHPGNQDNLSRTHSGCLYWYRSRHYDAARGRFGQADKWGKSKFFPILFHQYRYVRNNPAIWYDPMGWEKIYFQVGYIADENKDVLLKEYGNPDTVRVNNSIEMFNYIRTKNITNDSLLSGDRAIDPIEEIIFIGHGHATPQAQVFGKYESGKDIKDSGLVAQNWLNFEEKYSGFYENYFNEKLVVEFRLCYVGMDGGEFLQTVAESLPNKTLTKAYTGAVEVKNNKLNVIKSYSIFGIKIPYRVDIDAPSASIFLRNCE